MDYFYPEQAQKNMIRQRLVNCYTEAAPDKLGNIDHIMKKYNRKEHILFKQLATKYEKIPECNILR
mgnify:CR=1 FL=1